MALDIREILASDQSYNDAFSSHYAKVREDYSNKELHVLVKVDDKETLRLTVSDFLVNLVLWKPFLYFRKPWKREFYFDSTMVNAGTLEAYLDRVIVEFLDDTNQLQLNECMSAMIEELGWFSLDFNMVIGNTINLRDFIELSKRSKEFDEIIHTKFDERTSTDEIEKMMDERTKRVWKILSEEPNVFRDYIRAKEGVNQGQFTQFAVNVGPKPDLKGNVYPKIVNTNFLVDGLQSVSDYYIDASGGRKAAIINFGQVKKAGYTMRKLSLLCMNTLLDRIKSPDGKTTSLNQDCGTPNTMRTLVDSPKTLMRLNGRYRRTLNDAGDVVEFTIDGEKDTQLIGQEINLRSPVTCAAKRICRKCYGELSKINNDIHVGILGIEILTSQLTQMLLSAKHLLKTNSEVISWPEAFLDIFALDANAVIVNPALDNESRYSLVLDDIIDNEEMTDDMADDLDFSKYVRGFKVAVRESGKVRFIKMEAEKDLFLSPYLENLLKTKSVKSDDGAVTLEFREIEFSEPLFFIEVENNELARHLHNILNLIDNKEHLNVQSKEEMLQKFLELLNESKISLDSVHAECVVRELIRQTGDVTKRPDFATPDPAYRMLRVSDAITNSESIVISFSFEKIKKQLYEPETYRKKASSFLDKLFH